MILSGTRIDAYLCAGCDGLGQNIDANMSRIQHLMQTRLLPAFKRFSVGTEPVREAARVCSLLLDERVHD